MMKMSTDPRQTEPRRRWYLLLPLVAVMLCSGCWTGSTEFQFNWVYVAYQERAAGSEDSSDAFSDAQIRNVAEILAATFGTPDKPQLPGGLEEIDVRELLDLYKLNRAAGPVGRDPISQDVRGLYRQHCAHCHGVTGDGMGPTATFLNPYPRDYRRGMFKFKLTRSTQKPNKHDLHRILKQGIPGTAMPSFSLLPQDERDALVEYVIYLSVRGEVERELINLLAAGEQGQLLLDPANKSAASSAAVKEVIQNVLFSWTDIQQIAVDPKMPDWWDELAGSQPDFGSATAGPVLDAGRALFAGKAGCITCHGGTALGDAQVSNYDKWTEALVDAKQPTLEMKLLPYNESYQQFGALSPRPIRPRNLRQGVYRGGRRPLDLYHRISQGINGTPMPNQEQTLTPEEIWTLVFYVQSLPYEHASRPATARNLQRRRPN